MVSPLTLLRLVFFFWCLTAILIYYYSLILSSGKWLQCKQHKVAHLFCRVLVHFASSLRISPIVLPQPIATPFIQLHLNNDTHWLQPRGGYFSDYGDGTCGMNPYRDTLLRILKRWKEIARDNNITYFLTYGSLLGSWRNGDLIPYDTDMDVYILSSDNEKISRIRENRTFSEFDDKFHLAMDEDWRILSLTKRRTLTCDGKRLDLRIKNYDTCTFKGPVGRLIKGEYFWLDLWDVDVVNGSVYDRYGPGYYYHYGDIFPLKKCFYMGLEMFCPNNPLVVFRAFYGNNLDDFKPTKKCQNGKWFDHSDIGTKAVFYHRNTDLMF